MNLQSYVYADKLPSEFDMSNGQNSLTVWSPKQNYGYITQFYTKGHIDDDDKGTKTIKILLTRGEQKQTFDVTIKGFLTKAQKQAIKQNQANSDLDVKQYLNLQTQPAGNNGQTFTFYRSLLRLKPGLSIKASEIPNYLTGEKIKEIADIETAKAGQMMPYFDNLLKQELPAGVELKFSNIKQPINRGVLAPQISADVQLIKKEQNQIKESAVVKMSINGFEYDQNYLNTNLLSQVADVFSTFDSPIKRDMEGPTDPTVKNFYNTKKASEIKTLESLKTEFWDRVSVDNNYVLEYEHLVLPPVKIKLLELVNGSQNDQNGSLKVRIKLSWKDLDQLESIEREITLFGFKPDGSTHP